MRPKPTVILRIPGIEEVDGIHNAIVPGVKVREVNIELVDGEVKRFLHQQVADVMTSLL